MVETTASPGRRSIFRTAKIVGGGAIFLLLACTGLIFPIVQFAWILTTGWITFLRRTGREMTVNVNSLAWFAACLILLAFLAHRTTIWLVRRPTEAASPDAAAPPIREWPFRRSCVLLLAVLCSFIAGVCLVGIMHETVWMATSKEPLVEKNSWRIRVGRTQSKNNLKQIGFAHHNHHDAHQGFPASITFDEIGRVRHGWVTSLLPFLDSTKLYNQVRFELPWSADENRPVFAQSLRELANPGVSRPQHDESGYALIDYAGSLLVFQPGRKRPISEITDGTSNTILAGEVNANFQPWGKPGNCRDPRLGLNKSPHGFGSPFVGGAQFLTADGAVRFISENIDPKVLKAIATPDGGEPVGDF
ncbi:MAG: DUF1559 domain-containing protein [Candidatus Saccharimonas sp.]|nr:DUF1559 domain-containing protein [Planctomycetaceae bacterium]